MYSQSHHIPLSIKRNIHNIISLYSDVALTSLRDKIKMGNRDEIIWNLLNENKLEKISPFINCPASFYLQGGSLCEIR